MTEKRWIPRSRSRRPLKEPVEQEYFLFRVRDRRAWRHATYLSLSTQAGNELSPREVYWLSRYWSMCSWTLRRAPLKKALLDAGIGDDIMGGYDNGILQPYFSL